MTGHLQQGSEFAGVVTGAEVPIEGWLIVTIAREGMSGWPEPIGAGLSRRCRCTLKGEVPPHTPFHALVVVPRRQETLLIEIRDVTAGEGEWLGAYQVRVREGRQGGERS